MAIATNGSHEPEESDDYLMELMGMKQDFPDEAMEAYGKIYFRYWDVLLKIAIGVTRNEESAQDLIADTFNMVYNKAGTFNKGKAKVPGNIKLSILKWMTVIMQRIFYDNYLDEAYKEPSDNENDEDSFLIDKRSVRKNFNEDYDDFTEQFDENENIEEDSDHIQNDSENIAQVKEYVNKLTERDRDIILTYYNHYIQGKKTPTIVLDDLEKRWQTTRDNIRKILEKFRKSIKESLQSKLLIRK
jgi:RNA polymerase sigma factor (sigma-70 family)